MDLIILALMAASLAGGTAVLAYVIYDFFCQKEEFDNNPVKEDFYKMYHQAKRDRLKQYHDKY